MRITILRFYIDCQIDTFTTGLSSSVRKPLIASFGIKPFKAMICIEHTSVGTVLAFVAAAQPKQLPIVVMLQLCRVAYPKGTRHRLFQFRK